MKKLFRLVVLLAGLTLLAAACGNDDTTPAVTGDGDTATAGDTTAEAPDEELGGTITVYSGRKEELVGPLLQQFEDATGVTVEVRYGDTAEMAAQILEEGGNTPADVFFGQDAGALGALAAEGRLTELSEEQLDAVPEAYRSADGHWVGTSGRARVAVYNTEAMSEEDLPSSIVDFTDPEWNGRLGWAPTNGSFQAFVTALRELEGEDGARAWLEGIQANSPQVFEGNAPIVEAVSAGEIDVGFVNHYYLFQLQAEGSAQNAANHFFEGGDVGSLVNVAGVGVIEGTDNEGAANAFVDFLLSQEAQEYFAETTYEVPLVDGVEPSEGVPGFEDLTVPDLDLNRLEDLEGTLALLSELGIV